MFRLIATIVCLLAAASVFAQAHSSSYTNDYQREAREIFDDIIGMRHGDGNHHGDYRCRSHGPVRQIACIHALRACHRCEWPVYAADMFAHGLTELGSEHAAH